jgi:dienelactone hydrolase
MRAAASAALLLLGSLAASAAAPPAPAEQKIVSEAVDYRYGAEKFTGWLSRDGARGGLRPGVLVVHEWWGLADHPKRRAEELAKLGYVAFAADMYGTGKLTTDPKQAGEWSGRFRTPEGKALGRARAAAALDVLRHSPGVDPNRIAAIGFCFGGTVALELAWSGADLKGVVSFHGNPTAPTPEEAKGVKASILVCHGGDDGFVPDAALAAFEKAMRDGSLDWTLVKYGGAVHAFTNPGADAYGIQGVKYDARADRRSWEHMRTFFRELFGE